MAGHAGAPLVAVDMAVVQVELAVTEIGRISGAQVGKSAAVMAVKTKSIGGFSVAGVDAGRVGVVEQARVVAGMGQVTVTATAGGKRHMMKLVFLLKQRLDRFQGAAIGTGQAAVMTGKAQVRFGGAQQVLLFRSVGVVTAGAITFFDRAMDQGAAEFGVAHQAQLSLGGVEQFGFIGDMGQVTGGAFAGFNRHVTRTAAAKGTMAAKAQLRFDRQQQVWLVGAVGVVAVTATA